VTFDAYGDQATAGTRSYGYDALGRLTADTPAAGGGGYQFSYVGKTGTIASDGVSGYSWDPSGSVLAGTGAPGGGTSGVLALTDAHGDVLGQFTAAGTGVSGSQAYDPWGTVTATHGAMAGMLGFQSAWSDPVSGKDLMGARWYNPAAGDFTSADTIHVSPVPDPAAADPFGYAAGNPLSFTDPTGHLIQAGTPATNPDYQADTAYANVFTQTYQQVGVTAAEANAAKAYAAVIAQKAAGEKLAQQQAAELKKQQAAAAKQKQEELARAERQRVQYNILRAMSVPLKPDDKPAPSGSSGGAFSWLESGAKWVSANAGNIGRASLNGIVTIGGVIITDTGIGIGTAGAVACGTGVLCVAGAPAIALGSLVTASGLSIATYGAKGLYDDVTKMASEACDGGDSFTPGTPVLLASGKAVPIASLKPGDKVLAADTATGKDQPETVAAVEVNHDTDLYDLTVKTKNGTEVIHTTSRHLFWDPYHNYWVSANKLSKGEHLKTSNGTVAVADGGSVPADHVGWMWDLTVPGNNDHDFYVETVTGAVLVHNASSAYVPPPAGKILPGFPNAKYIGNRGGRATWTDGKMTLQWDYQHGAVEVYSKNGTHLGEFDPNDGSQNKPGDPNRSPSGC